MHRALVWEGQDFADRAWERALTDIGRLIPTDGDAESQTLSVFNPLCHDRSDIVRLQSGQLPANFRIVDNTTGNPVAIQKLSGDETVFIAEDVPSLGYKTYTVKASPVRPDCSSISPSSGWKTAPPANGKRLIRPMAVPAIRAGKSSLATEKPMTTEAAVKLPSSRQIR